MAVSRRKLLQGALVAAGTVPLFGCESLTSKATQWLGQDIPEKSSVAESKEIDRDFHLLSRATYGIWPGDLDRLRNMGAAAWLDEQLHPERIDDRACELRARRFESIHLDTATCFEFKKPFLRDELTRHALVRAIYSRRQLYEVMVGFWSDHLNIDIGKGDAIYAKATDDRTVIRPHALGKFRDLIAASATSAAMLIYLDGKENRRPSPQSIPNENYGRELLELHTLGVDGGYTQKDVYEVARCLTGWSIHTPWQRGQVFFDPAQHDDGAKQVLGHTIAAGGGEKDLQSVLDIVCKHPSTARHIAGKLAKHFVCEDPPPKLVEKIAETFTRTDGDIKSLLSCIFTEAEFYKHPGAKIKRPFHFIASSLRALAADTYAHQSLTEYLNRMGQGTFQYPTPDGYPDIGSRWVSTMLWRWNFALGVCCNSVPDVSADLPRLATAIGAITAPDKTDKIDIYNLFAHFIGRKPTEAELGALREYLAQSRGKASAAQKQELVGLVLASPAFQRC
ncbi:MAG: DUF1800 domain-containing protein [Cyanobacteria bacterium SZAS LIN-3]|nr:DUF1800 domain-containing protein [Cyanobacteria bacterium SZAS LIN-3]MBS2009166.1 DUF1800 domain-containing protein [Cyanobacteria bacterium SZAS TMP-1]